MQSPAPPRLDLSLALADPEATEAFGTALAGALGPGCVVLLSGPIGAGKSHLARAVIRSLLAAHDRPPEDIPSPTYTLVQTYDLGETEVWHADLYRLGGPDDVFELGLDAAFETAICLVEWPDRLGEATPPGALEIALSADPASDGRIAKLTATGPRWTALARRLADAGASR
ncbi:tRNA (adenosine(37)-N6)-threonylcarbamoyltransferase complex ATPase subunit type 1 TsaE [Tropicimonas sediminicola]|uniref:tRNA threonylcarbamoyladenosine biosynthesis protein TsaE n=1 Tax=Tropicimonas sediminicola TaxID=1031541 RepID=A0A239KYM8_9RHOB|nr:tRNA (adenosine(37)-N6)-threonylcarbamoyltransferase complex ATPase subunit type 1 TsaE [Tropicimonas sediminicola]SNT22758.1 tRNA threonylcarbamoyladenosine biosynthesis protein TsaE [Tropicimonas sediminicola]